MDFEESLRALSDKTRVIIDKYNRIDENTRISEVFQGACGLAQCITGYSLLEAGRKIHPLATQSMGDKFYYGHAAMVAEEETQTGKKFYLIDPTFVQFCDEDGLPHTPGNYMDQTEDGRALKKELLENGFFELTRRKAQIYLNSMCLGQAPFETPEQCYAFCINPPEHPYHFKHGKKDSNGRDYYDPVNLRSMGHYIDPHTVGLHAT